MAHNYDVGTRAWQPDPTEGWVASQVAEKKVQGHKVRLVFELENGEVKYNSLIGVCGPVLMAVQHRPKSWKPHWLPCSPKIQILCHL